MPRDSLHQCAMGDRLPVLTLTLRLRKSSSVLYRVTIQSVESDKSISKSFWTHHAWRYRRPNILSKLSRSSRSTYGATSMYLNVSNGLPHGCSSSNQNFRLVKPITHLMHCKTGYSRVQLLDLSSPLLEPPSFLVCVLPFAFSPLSTFNSFSPHVGIQEGDSMRHRAWGVKSSTQKPSRQLEASRHTRGI